MICLFLIKAVKNGLELELCGKAAVITLRIHLPQLASSLHSGHLQTSIQQLGQAVRIKVAEYRALAGRNLAGLRFMQRSLLRSREEKQASIDVTTVPLASSGKKAKKGTSGQKTQKKRRKVSLSEIKEGLEEFMDD